MICFQFLFFFNNKFYTLFKYYFNSFINNNLNLIFIRYISYNSFNNNPNNIF